MAEFYSYRPLGCSEQERNAVIDMQANAGAKSHRITIVSEEHPLPPYPQGVYFEGFSDFYPGDVLPEFDYPLVEARNG